MTGKKEDKGKKDEGKRKEPSALETFKNLELMLLADHYIKEKPEIALMASQEFYRRHKFEGDGIIANAMNQASIGISEGTGLSDGGLVRAIRSYASSANKAYIEMGAIEFADYVGSRGMKDIAGEGRDLLGKYAKTKIGDIFKDAKDKKNNDAQIAAHYLSRMFTYYIETHLYGEITLASMKEEFRHIKAERDKDKKKGKK